jgi:hypothetical protein
VSAENAEVKTIYLARRAAALTREQFPRRWRRHGQLAMSLGFWRDSSGYYHCDVHADPPAAIDSETGAAWSGEYDGVGLVYFPSSSAYESLVTHRDFPRLLADEHGAFIEPVSNFSVLTTEEVLLQAPGTAAKFFAFLRAADGVSAQEFAERWNAHAALVMRSNAMAGLLTKYVHNHPVPVDAVSGEDASIQERITTGLQGVAGVAEVGFASRADLRTFLAHEDRRGLRADLEQFCAVDELILVETDEVTMDARTSLP